MSKEDLVTVQMFKAQRSTKRFRKNQKVWIKMAHGNHLSIHFKWRGKGRYVNGIIDKHSNNWRDFNPVIGTYEYKKVPVLKEFAERHELQVVTTQNTDYPNTEAD